MGVDTVAEAGKAVSSYYGVVGPGISSIELRMDDGIPIIRPIECEFGAFIVSFISNTRSRIGFMSATGELIHAHDTSQDL